MKVGLLYTECKPATYLLPSFHEYNADNSQATHNQLCLLYGDCPDRRSCCHYRKSPGECGWFQYWPACCAGFSVRKRHCYVSTALYADSASHIYYTCTPTRPMGGIQRWRPHY